jgi:MFS family permease
MSETRIESQGIFSRIAQDYWQGLQSLARCPREIWIMYLMKILEGLCYFATVLVLMIFLIEDMGLSEVNAGWTYGIWSAGMSLFMLFTGFIADSLGIKKALIVGLVIALVGRLAVTFTVNPYIIYPGLLFHSVGFAFMIPLIAAAVKHYSTKRAQKYAFSWYYVVMNVGAATAGLGLDPLREAFSEPTTFELLGTELTVLPTQIIFLVALVATIGSLVLAVFFIRGHVPESAYDEGEPESDVEEKPKAAAPAKGKESVMEVMRDVTQDKLFWIFIVFMLLLVMVKMIFQYNHSLYPVYMDRIGLKDVMGKVYAINPIIIIFLVPVMTSITAKMHAYKVILVGSFISAASVLFMGIGEGIVWIVLFQVFLSFGEALWSPRLYDYTANIAPPGRVASYMAFSKVPMFFAKVGAGPASGFLLYHLCSETGPRNTELMWIIVGASTLLSPLTLWFGRKWLDVESRRKEEAVTDSGQTGG